MLKKHGEFLASLFAVADILIILLSWNIAYYLKFQSLLWDISFLDSSSRRYLLLIPPILILWPIVLSNMGLYKQRRISKIFSEIFDVLKASILANLILVAVTYLVSKDGFSRQVFIYFGAISVFLLLLERFTLRGLLRYFRRLGYNTRRVLIVGAGDLGERVVGNIRETPWTGLEIAGFLDDKKDVGTMVEGLEVLGNIRKIKTVIHEHKIDQVFIALQIQYYKKMMYVLENLLDEVTTVRIIPDIYQAMTLNASVEDLHGMPMINMTDSRMYGWNIVLKRFADIVFSMSALIIMSPIILLIFLGIKLTSKGPVIFKQRRYGLDGEYIKIYKFRSMSVCEDGPNVPQAKKGDARITPLGGFLRRTSLDELPQFFNVLQGRMSVVGPRPHAVAHNEEYRKVIRSYMLRHKVKPGITGWAQVNGWRGETDSLDKMEKRVEYDLFYIENWSPWLDMKIVLLTIIHGMINKQAY